MKERGPLLGIGLRPHHYPEWAREGTPGLVEVLADNYLNHAGGPALYHLRRCLEGKRTFIHSIGLNIAGSAPLDAVYLSQLKHFYQLTQPEIVSDHLCFSRAGSAATFDLLPFPLTDAELTRVAARVHKVQDFLQRPIALENLSAYHSWPDASRGELAFLGELCERTGCQALLDANNIIVSANNLKYQAETSLFELSPEHIAYVHVAGHTVDGPWMIDTHDQPVCDATLALVRKLLVTAPDVPIILERDDEWPLEDLLLEWARLRGALTLGPAPSNVRERRQHVAFDPA